MRRVGTRALVAVLIAGACVAFSGCFHWSSFRWSSIKVEAGGKRTNALVGLTPDVSAADDRMVQFFLFGFNEADDLGLGGKRTWDVKGRFGGPQPLFLDGAVATAALNSDNCEANGSPLSTIPDVDWFAVRTEGEVDDRDKPGRVALSSIGVKADAGTTVGQRQVYMLPGFWNDGGGLNGIPESGEVSCLGAMPTVLTVR